MLIQAGQCQILKTNAFLHNLHAQIVIYQSQVGVFLNQIYKNLCNKVKESNRRQKNTELNNIYQKQVINFVKKSLKNKIINPKYMLINLLILTKIQNSLKCNMIKLKKIIKQTKYKKTQKKIFKKYPSFYQKHLNYKQHTQVYLNKLKKQKLLQEKKNSIPIKCQLSKTKKNKEKNKIMILKTNFKKQKNTQNKNLLTFKKKQLKKFWIIQNAFQKKNLKSLIFKTKLKHKKKKEKAGIHSKKGHKWKFNNQKINQVYWNKKQRKIQLNQIKNPKKQKT
ncbi:hypothetical protein IMG5_092330 [Ichthyophthirius multifiliis]|uniref:Uncharacterized protein n=1 Tax=Ichthyophthirius multifiliis TaxID=5932 RepID=G0QRE9_ICHMU|nr:hypothetical protein IMG5_092330 [Ichthyophthirius multifiliis]EGR32218.1 hypothetical protein IMG5_092330 [Ichthyophthirius multifiliis]|eukprot:XP_004035704.1 hypothetical protein IMG5_092330 [Ichthyophthirius multifiliis]